MEMEQLPARAALRPRPQAESAGQTRSSGRAGRGRILAPAPDPSRRTTGCVPGGDSLARCRSSRLSSSRFRRSAIERQLTPHRHRRSGVMRLSSRPWRRTTRVTSRCWPASWSCPSWLRRSWHGTPMRFSASSDRRRPHGAAGHRGRGRGGTPGSPGCAVVEAAQRAPRPVILRIIRPSERRAPPRQVPVRGSSRGRQHIGRKTVFRGSLLRAQTEAELTAVGGRVTVATQVAWASRGRDPKVSEEPTSTLLLIRRGSQVHSRGLRVHESTAWCHAISHHGFDRHPLGGVLSANPHLADTGVLNPRIASPALRAMLPHVVPHRGFAWLSVSEGAVRAMPARLLLLCLLLRSSWLTVEGGRQVGAAGVLIGHPLCCLDHRRERAKSACPVQGLMQTSPSRRR